MRRSVKWEADDGAEFATRGEVEAYERTDLWRRNVASFLCEHMGWEPAQATEFVAGTPDLWDAIRDNAVEFAGVLQKANPARRPGRPPGKKAAAKKKGVAK